MDQFQICNLNKKMLDELLKQSKEYRQKVAIFATFIIGIAIFSAWLVIAGYNLKMNAVAGLLPEKDEMTTEQQFRKNLPSLRQEETVVTELARQDSAAKAGDVVSEEERKSFLEKLLGN